MNRLPGNVSWTDAVQELQSRGEPYVLVTVLGVRGSTPRDNGTKMVIGAEDSYGSIGGGHLEYRAHEIAAELMTTDGEQQRIENIRLGASLGQCCGGHTNLLFESFKGAQMTIAVFGAGHVGAALVPILAQLPCRLHWVDSRESFRQQETPANVSMIISDEPAEEVALMPAGSDFIVMTHNHQLDYQILRAVLQRGDARYVGLIGSKTKWRRFQMRMQHRGHEPDFYQAVHCPVGLSAVPGKRPVEVAVSIAAELIALNHEESGARPTQRGIGATALQEMKETVENP